MWNQRDRFNSAYEYVHFKIGSDDWISYMCNVRWLYTTYSAPNNNRTEQLASGKGRLYIKD